MLWTEKYRPTTLSEIVGQEHFVLDAQTWVAEMNMPNVLISGVAGTGKTTASIALARDILKKFFKDNFFEVNASDDRKLETVRDKIKEIARTVTMGDVPFKIMLLDEMDGMTKDAQNALKRIMERYSNNIRFIITCNDKHKIIHPLQSRCANYRFNLLQDKVILDMMLEIIEKEGLVSKIDLDDLRRFIYSINGDIRRAITELQATKSSGNSLVKQIETNLDDYAKAVNMLLEKDGEVLDYIHNMVYKGFTVKEICLGLHDVVVNSQGMDNALKFKFLKVIGETEWRSNTMTPKVILSWMVGNLT
jgi:replication factor C small subunit|tara:strand:- start:5135 stop:6049 length:915 start_codon:yes stop_codon:yes gene_type:complete